MSEAYWDRGVSASKSDVHKAISGQDKGLFPTAFCKVVADVFDQGDSCVLMHADGAGTKSSLAYLYYRETGDDEVFKGIAQDSIVMNLDDLICVGATSAFILSNTIGRNAHRVDGGVIKKIIEGYAEFADSMKAFGIDIVLSGGETADVGDLVSTLIVDSTFYTKLLKSRVVDCGGIRDKDVIVGLSSTGKAVYENEENMGIGSNGLTAARHLLLSSEYRARYPETYSSTMKQEMAYCGKYRVCDPLPGTRVSVGKALLSPTRTYAPVIKAVLDQHFSEIHGIIHCTGGGQVKCKNFGSGLTYIKDSLFEIPPLFREIGNHPDITPREMFRVFNMGHRMELYCPPRTAGNIIAIAERFGIEAKIVGRVQAGEDEKNRTVIRYGNEEYRYE